MKKSLHLSMPWILTMCFFLQFAGSVTAGKTDKAGLTESKMGNPHPSQVILNEPPAVDYFFEDFSTAVRPNMPEGWSTIVQSTESLVQTVNTHNPVTPPNQVRFASQGDGNAILALVSPKVKNFESNWLRFYGRMIFDTHLHDVVIGYSSSRDNMADFVPVDTVTITGPDHLQQTVLFSDVLNDNDEYHIVIVVSNMSAWRQLMVDNFLWETASTEAVMLIDRENIDFFVNPVGEVSDPEILTITNDGLQDLILETGDFVISGPDADAFSIDSVPALVEIAFGESISLSLRFAPLQALPHQATLSIKGLEIGLQGIGATDTIAILPHFEDFNQTLPPDLPFAWSKINDNPGYAASVVQTTTALNPHSPPNHAQILSNDNANANMMLITPAIADFENMRLRFWARCNIGSNIPDLIIGTMTDPEDASTFVAFQTFEGGDDLTSAYQQFVVNFDHSVLDHHHIAFKHGSTPNFNRSILIDNVYLDAPTQPEVLTNPTSVDFGLHQIQTTTFPFEVEIINEGVGTLVISPEDISISGSDAEDFILHNLQEEVSLGSLESAFIQIRFLPEATGTKSAFVQILDYQLPLAGEAIDATISLTPHHESFDQVEAPALPPGWTRIVDNPLYALALVETTTGFSPFSPPNHVRILSNNNEDAEVMLISPPVHNIHQKVISFRARASSATSIPDLLIGTMTDPTDPATFTLYTTLEADEDLTAEYAMFTVILDEADPDDGSHIAFKHGATPSGNRAIFIDDFMLDAIDGPYTITFEVTGEEGQDITDAVITLGEITNEPGDYVFTEIPEGIYSYTVEAPFHQSYEGDNLDVYQNILVEVQMTALTYEVIFDVKDTEGEVIEDATITLGDITNATGDYVFTGVSFGTHSYLVEADEYDTVQNDQFQLMSDTLVSVEMMLSDPLFDVVFAILDEDNQPVDHAVITFGNITNAPGNYIFEEMPAGEYDYTIVALGYYTLEETGFELSGDSTIEVILEYSGEFIVSESNVQQSWPVVVYDGSDFLTVYTDRRQGGYSYYSRFISKNGDVAPEQETVEFHPVMAGMHHLARGDKSFLFTWSRQRTPHDFRRDAFAVALNDQGEPIGPKIEVSGPEVEHSPVFMRVAFDGENYLVIWQDGSPAQNARILGQFICGTEHQPIGGNFPIRPEGLGDNPAQIYPDILFNGHNYLVTWDDNRTGERSVYGMFIDKQGQQLGDDFAIADKSHRQMLARVAYNGQYYLAVWGDRRHGTKSSIYGQMFDGEGNLIGEEILLSQLENNEERSYPRVASNGNQFMVAWNQEHIISNTIFYNLYGALINADGTLAGEVFDIVENTNVQREPEIAAHNEKFLVVWQDARHDIASFDIYGRFFDAEAPAPRPAPSQLQADYADGAVVLQWHAPAGKELLHYNVYRNSILLASEVSNTQYSDAEVVAGEEYYYYVTAIYSHGESEASNTAEVMIPLDFVSLSFIVSAPEDNGGQQPVEGALVDLGQYGEGTTDTNGSVIFDDVPTGISLNYLVTAMGYFDYSGEITDISDSMTIEVTLEPDGTSVNEWAQTDRISISPNPATDRLLVTSDEKIENLAVTDLSGKVHLITGKVHNKEFILDVSELPAGIYLVTVTPVSGVPQTLRMVKH